MDLKLPPEVRPIWIEGVFTSEYERDTLPLLFASDRLFDEYYDALILKYPHVSVALEQIRARNAQARQQRADGLWQDCVESLGHCVHLRRCVFEETDFQFAAAQKHHILSMLNFATFFLKESDGQDNMLMRSFELFKAAEDATKDVQNKNDRAFLLAAVHNNFASYFAKRRKYKAAAQRLSVGLRVWSHLNLHSYDLYFAVQRGSGEAWSNRFEDSYKLLKQATAFAPQKKENEDVEGAGVQAEVDDDPEIAPVRFQIQMLNSGVSLTAASNIALHHNIAVSLIGMRRYKEAIPWCSKAMDLATAESAFLKSNHPIVVLVRRAQEFCDKTSFVTKFSDFRMKQDEFVSDDFRRMQTVIHKSTSGSRAASANPGQRQRPKTQQQESESRRTKEVCGTASKHPNSATAAKAYFPHAAPRVSKPSQAEALRTYLRRYSERQLVEEYGIEGKKPKKKKPQPPPKKEEEQEGAKEENKAEEAAAAEEEKKAPEEKKDKEADKEQEKQEKEPEKLDADNNKNEQRSPSSSRSRDPSAGSRRSTDYDSRSRTPPSRSPSSSRSPSPSPEPSPKKQEEPSPKKEEEEAPTPAKTEEPEKDEKAGAPSAKEEEASPKKEEEPQAEQKEESQAEKQEEEPKKEESSSEKPEKEAAKEEETATPTETTTPQEEQKPQEEAEEKKGEDKDESKPNQAPAESKTEDPQPQETTSGETTKQESSEPAAQESSEPAPSTESPTKKEKTEEAPAATEKSEVNQSTASTKYDEDFEDDSQAGSPKKEEPAVAAEEEQVPPKAEEPEPSAESPTKKEKPQSSETTAQGEVNQSTASTKYDEDFEDDSQAGSPKKEEPAVAKVNESTASGTNKYDDDFEDDEEEL